ncbi:DUF4115 domain-containing protein [Streptomyces bambusae]|uniref:RodZ domain-containing protein n=1 Tax=Streptomyces bambusae TaxID=1550616 RepID=UPI001CFD0791|nr:RodZ domain-containing protein [Streptomyces bambusae]MCB5164677.1 DUF4115 domain-containing protein [Streptomyces bambusae]
MGFGAGLPERIGVYVVERQLGAGGMGTVYLARSRGGRPVAVKVAHPDLAADPHFRERFRAEVNAARRVGGFHTAPVVDADPDAEAPWLATAYIAGPTLSALVREQGPFDEQRLRLLGAALSEALLAIHACGLVHRDLKPGNIIMAEDGPRVLDFGIARAVESTRLTAAGAAFGTPGFLAPEQAQGLEVTGAADVFALGTVLVAAAGGSAFGSGTPMGLMYRSVHETADLSAVPEGLRPLLAACLAKDPAQRPSPARLLDSFAPGDPAGHSPAPGAPPGRVPVASGRSRDGEGDGDGDEHAGDGGTGGHEATLPDGGDARGTEPAGGTLPLGAGGRVVALAGDDVRGDGPLWITSAGRSRRRVVLVALAAVTTAGVLGGALYLTLDGDRTGPRSASPSESRRASSPAPAPGAVKSQPRQEPSPTPTPGRSDGGAAPAPKDVVTIAITGEGPGSWLSAKDSAGRLIFDGVLGPGETRTFTDKERIDLVLGNAGAVKLLVNGKRIEDEFEDGRVERLTYTKGF